MLSAQETARLEAAIAATRQRAAQRLARLRVICGAKTRKGKPCRCKSVPGKRRCKFHGGLSTGPKTADGIERIRAAQRARWERWRRAHDAAIDAPHR
jgi:hypothetical protein